MRLQLEVKDQPDTTGRVALPSGGAVMWTPGIGEDYWVYRVKLSDTQAIVGFPKFNTVGIGFAVEDEDWNSNLPYTCSAEHIYDHIAENKGDESITREDCLEAIRMVQAAVKHIADFMRSAR